MAWRSGPSGARLEAFGGAVARLGTFGARPSRLFGPTPWFATNQPAQSAFIFSDILLSWTTTGDM